MREIWFLLKKEVTLELRNRYALGGILLYVLSTVFIIYFSFNKPEASAWNVLFWIVVLFASVNAVVKGFQQESGKRQLFYYTLAHPLAIILSKTIYHCLLLLTISLLTFAAFSLVAGNPVKNMDEFLLALLLGSIGFSINLTFVSAIASKANNSATLMAILSFPLVIPILMTLIKLSTSALALSPMGQEIQSDILILVAIDLLLLAFSLILFPFLWRD